MLRLAICLSLSALVALAVGCVSDTVPSPSSDSREDDRPKSKFDAAARAEGKKFLLPSEPADSKGVIEVRKSAMDGDEVVVAGQVGGIEKPFTDGRASFVIADPSLKPTEGCPCPWDFCEYPNKELEVARLLVKFVDEEGKTLKWDAREMFGLEELRGVVIKGKVSRVVVKGKVSGDDKVNVIVVASGIFLR